jgi:ATP-grasp domain-containing protein
VSTSTRFIFCSDPLAKSEPDSVYASEFEAAEKCGFSCALINFEALVNDGNPERAVARVTQSESETKAVFRGWMLKPGDYAKLYEALLNRNLRLINSPEEYRHCHYLPESFELIRARSPRTIWFELHGAPNFDDIFAGLREFGSRPLVVKDFVKSRKHEWADACFIPSAGETESVRRVVTNFVERQGSDLNEGLVFRDFVDFQSVGKHPKSGLPLFQEYRIFFLSGEVLDAVEYWESGDYAADNLPTDEFRIIAQRIRSHFFTMDVAKTKAGEWLIVELGDGQVAGLPEKLDVNGFYTKFSERLSRN